MWGIVPAAGRGSRIQPLAFSKELLPVGSRSDKGFDRPCAVSEYLIERLILGGADKICFVISPGKSDILEYYGDRYGSAELAYVVQPQASGLCDAVFRYGVVSKGRAELVARCRSFVPSFPGGPSGIL
jgi:glucose-1-phosphate thymidylyltransferase